LQDHKIDDWLEAIIFLFDNYILNILDNSSHFVYQEITMPYKRGRIVMQPYAIDNLVTGKHQLMHCTFEPFLNDNLSDQHIEELILPLHALYF